MKDRIKALRKELGLSMNKFGESLGVNKASISRIESGENFPSSMLQKSICTTFNVNEEWLKTGEGDMFIELTPEEEVMKFVAETHALPEDDPRVILLRTIANMSPEEWDVVDLMIKHIKENKKEGC